MCDNFIGRRFKLAVLLALLPVLAEPSAWASQISQGPYSNGAFSNGAFSNAAFGNGAFGNGTFGNGAFGNGAFGNAAFGNGAFGNGAFGNATFGNGAFGNAAFGNATFGNATFGNAAFGNGAFSNATFGNGAFSNATYSNATFGNGTFGNGTFSNGTYSNGTFSNGAFGNGTYSNSTFGNSTFGNGTMADSAAGEGFSYPDGIAPGAQLLFPAGVTQLYFNGRYWQRDQTWMQFVSGGQILAEDASVLIDFSPQAADGTPYRYFTVNNGQIVLRTDVCDTLDASGACSAAHVDAQLGGMDVAGALLRAYVFEFDPNEDPDNGGTLHWDVISVKVAGVMEDSSETSIDTVYEEVVFTDDAGVDHALGNKYKINKGPLAHLRYRLAISGSSDDTEADAGWRNVCGEDALNVDDSDESDTNLWQSNFGVMFRGMRNNKGDFVAKGLSYSCDGGTMAKALRFAGYRPWETYGIDTGANGRPFGLISHISATRAFMADYCENNHGLTVAGTLIDIWDSAGLNTQTDDANSDLYMFSADSAFTTDHLVATDAAPVDCTGDFDQSGAKAAPTIPSACATVQSKQGGNGDLVILTKGRYGKLTNDAACDPRVFQVLGGTYSATPNEPTVSIASSTMCGHSPSVEGEALAVDCNACTAAVYALPGGVGANCVMTASQLYPGPGQYWDSTCVSYVTGANALAPCIATADANGGLTFQAPTYDPNQMRAMWTSKAAYSVGEAILTSWSGIAETTYDLITISNVGAAASAYSSAYMWRYQADPADGVRTIRFPYAHGYYSHQLPEGTYVARYLKSRDQDQVSQMLLSVLFGQTDDLADLATIIAESPPFTVGVPAAQGTITTADNVTGAAKTTFASGEAIRVNYKNTPVCYSAYVHADPVTSTYTPNYTGYHYLYIGQNGMQMKLPEGQYKLRMVDCDPDQTLKAESATITVGTPTNQITTDKVGYALTDTVRLSFPKLSAAMYDTVEIIPSAGGTTQCNTGYDDVGVCERLVYQSGGTYAYDVDGYYTYAAQTTMDFGLNPSNDPTVSGPAGLAPGTYVAKYLRALSGTVVATSPVFAVGMTPGAISGLAVGASIDAPITLTWAAAAYATSYQIQRSVNGGTYAALATSATLSYTDAAVIAGNTYAYKVSGQNGVGPGALSAAVSKTLRPAAPTAPTGIAGNAQVALSWTASNGAASYTVSYGTSSSGPFGTTGCTATAPAVTCTTASLTNSTTYWFVARATNAGGTSLNSTAVSATPALPPPAAPTLVAAGALAVGATGATNVSPALPAGIAANDVLLLVAETSTAQAVAPTITTTTGTWTTLSSVVSGSGTTGTRLTVAWKRAVTGEAIPKVTLSPADHIQARTIAYRGCVTTGNPYDAFATGTNATAATTTTFFATAPTAAAANRLVLLISARADDSATTNYTNTAWAANGTTTWVEDMDGGTTNGDGGGFALAHAVRATAGAVSTAAATSSAAAIKSNLILLLRP